MNRIGFWWDIKTANIEYYDIQYAAERTNTAESAVTDARDFDILNVCVHCSVLFL